MLAIEAAKISSDIDIDWVDGLYLRIPILRSKFDQA